MIHELAHEGGARRVGGAVRVVPAEGRIHDQVHRPCSEIIFGVQDTPGLAKLHQGRLEFRTGWRKGAKLREQATKPVYRNNKPSMLGPLGVSSTARENARGARNHHTHPERSEELPSTDPTRLLVLLSAHSVLLLCRKEQIGFRHLQRKMPVGIPTRHWPGL